MKIYQGLSGLLSLPRGVALTIGNFDGVHRGHQSLINLTKNLGGEAGSAIATFEPHPFVVLRPKDAPPRLTTKEQKERLLKELGVDHLVYLEPKPELLSLTALDFWQKIRDELQPAHMIEGKTFTFGKGRDGTITRLKEWADQSPVKLHIAPGVRVPLLDMHTVPVSSSLIRWLVINGRVREAAICLNRPYTIEGTVIKGFQRGRTIGVPTANLDCGEQLMPADGVYAARAIVDGVSYPAALSIGSLPTFEERKYQVEAHLIGFDGDLYDRTLRVEIIDWIREQWKFDGLEPLKRRIATDIEITSSLQQLNVSEAIVETAGS